MNKSFADEIAMFNATFDFEPDEIQEERMSASDGTFLAYEFRGQSEANNVYIIYHGGGANKKLGYQHLASNLTENSDIVAYTVDIRGHGSSGGKRGDAKSPERVWSDVDDFLKFVKSNHKGAQIYLCGHSSGCGMLLNAYEQLGNQEAVSGIWLIAPEFGYRAKIDRSKSAIQFSSAKKLPFILESMTGGLIGGHIKAVELAYPPSSDAEGKDYVTKYSVNMANALTPSAPSRQLKSIDVPVWIAVAKSDDLINADALVQFVQNNKPKDLTLIELPETGHLEAIIEAATAIKGTMSKEHANV